MAAPHPRIYLSPPHMAGGEPEAVAACLASGWVAPAGPQLEAFERALSETTGAPHAVALASGTAGLHLALVALGIGPGHGVACSSLTFVASANAIRYVGAEPVFIDSDEESWNMSPHWLEVALRSRAAEGRPLRAVLLTHLYGRCANVEAILALCAQYGALLIEDAAEALGARGQGRMAGTFGVAGIYSFNGNKIVTTGGGGALVTADAALAARVRHLATQAREPAPHYEHAELGWNYRLSSVAAALGTAQLAHLPGFIRLRRENFLFYEQHLADLPGLRLAPALRQSGYEDTGWLTTLVLDPATAPLSPEVLRLRLEAEAIEARPVWKPLHFQPLYAGCGFYGGAVAEMAFAQGLCLPSGSNLGPDGRTRVVAAIRAAWSA